MRREPDRNEADRLPAVLRHRPANGSAARPTATSARSDLQSAAASAGDDLVLLDVREPNEWNIARLEGAKLIP